MEKISEPNFIALLQLLAKIVNEHRIPNDQMGMFLKLTFGQKGLTEEVINDVLSRIDRSMLGEEENNLLHFWESKDDEEEQMEIAPYENEVTDDANVLIRPILFYKDQLCFFKKSVEGKNVHTFGGINSQFSYSPERSLVHLLFTISTQHTKLLKTFSPIKIPIIFPFFYDSEIEYSFSGSGDVVIEQGLKRAPSFDWPYKNYPKIFEPINFSCSKPLKCSGDSFRSYLWQYYEWSDDEAILVIPESEEYGIRLWSSNNNRECVNCVFKINMVTNKVYGFTDCG